MAWGVFFEFLRLYCLSFGIMCVGCMWGMQAAYSVYGLCVGVLHVRIMREVCGRRCECAMHVLCERRRVYGGFWM